MNTEQLRKHLDAFYAGESTPEQERELREYFAGAYDIADEFRADAAMFRAMTDAAAPVPEDMEQRILAATTGRRTARHSRSIFLAVAAAAAVALLLVIQAPSPSPYREVTDPAEAEAIVLDVTAKLQKTADKLAILNNLPL